MTLQGHEIPTVTIINTASERMKGISTSVIYELKEDGSDDLFVDFSTYSLEQALTSDILLEYITVDVDSSYTDISVKSTTDSLKLETMRIIEQLLLITTNPDVKNVRLALFLSSYLQKLLDDTAISYRVNIGTIHTAYDAYVDMYIWGTQFFNTKTDIFCANESICPTMFVDVHQASGRLTSMPADIFSTIQDFSWCMTSVFSTMLQRQSISTELTTISGRLQRIDNDIFSTALGIGGVTSVDLKTRSLFTGDFFIAPDTFITASSMAWVDIVDHIYTIDTNNTYLEVNGVLASGIWFDDIPNGKRLYYDPLDDFYSEGVLIYSLHAESSIGEVEEKDFYLLYGYNLEPNEILDWGPNKTIVVRAEAKNLVFCSNKEGMSFDFVTVDLRSTNLNCLIRPVGYVDLQTSIFPQSTVFYYGQTYTVRICGVKDFSGNVMPDFEYTFTIENAPGD